MLRLAQRQRRSGQTIIILALLMGILMVIAALVIDIGSMSNVRAEEQYVCDSGALAGIAETVNTGSATAGIARALDVVRQCGYVKGQNGVQLIQLEPYNATSNAFSETTSNRFRCTIWRTLPQYFASVIGIRSTYVQTYATAAVMGNVPIDVSFNAEVGFPTTVNLSQFGPDALYTFGDAYSTTSWPGGLPNPHYNPIGYEYDLFVPQDILAATGSSLARVEIFDADTWNQGNSAQPSTLRDTNGDPTEPEVGGIDEIRSKNGENLGGFTFSQLSTQTEFKVLDAVGRTVATASYGPLSNTPYWGIRQDPSTDRVTTLGAGDTAQSAVDLKWITPQGFQFDTAAWTPPFKMFVRTTSGASENGYMLRIGSKRASGQVYDQTRNGITPLGAFAIYGAGRVPINFPTGNVTEIPIGNVPSNATKLTVTNFDTDVGSEYVNFGINSFDRTQNHPYPVLFPLADQSVAVDNKVIFQDAAGVKYSTKVQGNLSDNGQFATSDINIPRTVPVPQTNVDGSLFLDRNKRIIITDSRAFEGGDLTITYKAGATDTSSWDVNWTGYGLPADQRIVLIR